MLDYFKSFKRLLPYMYVWSPAIATFIFIIILGDNIPIDDDWVNPGLSFYGLEQSGFSLKLLFSQYNEAHLVFPRLVWFILGGIIGWNLKIYMFLSLFLAVLVSWGFFCVIRKIFSLRHMVFAVTFLVNLILFSWLQYENWIWGHQWITFIPIVCLFGILLINNKPFKFRNKFLGTIVLSFVAMFSFPNGIAVWFLSYFVLFKDNLLPVRKTSWYAWLAASFGSFFLYFGSYITPVNHPTVTDIVTNHFKEIFGFFITSTACPLVPKAGNLGLVVGVALILSGVILLIVWYKKRKVFPPQIYSLVIVAAFSLMTLMQISIARTSFVSVCTSRYYGQVALFLIVLIIFSAYLFKKDLEDIGVCVRCSILSLCLLAIPILPGYYNSIADAQYRQVIVQEGSILLSLCESDMISSCDSRRNRYITEDIALKVKPFISNKDVFRPLSIDNIDIPDKIGWVDSVEKSSSVVHVKGWANRYEGDNQFIFVRVIDNVDNVYWDIVTTNVARPDVHVFLNSRPRDYGWASAIKVPQGSSIKAVQVWSINTKEWEMYPLPNTPASFMDL